MLICPSYAVHNYVGGCNGGTKKNKRKRVNNNKSIGKKTTKVNQENTNHELEDVDGSSCACCVLDDGELSVVVACLA